MMEKCKGYLKNNFSNSPKAKTILAVVTPVLVLGVMVLCIVANVRKTVTINVDGNKQVFVTYKRTVKDVLQQAEVELASKDKVQPSLEEKINEDEVITVNRAVKVEIVSNDKRIVIETAEETVNDMLDAECEELKAKNIEFDKTKDEVIPSLDTKIKENLSIQLVDVDVSTEVVVNTISYDTITEEDSTLSIDTKEIRQAGQNGEEEVTYRITKKDGKEVSREKISSKILKEAVTEIVAEGTAKVYASRSGDMINYKEVLYCEATAYCGGSLTATGTVPSYNPGGISTIAVDPRVIPLGSLVYVEGYGKAIAADTGGAIQGNIIDVYVDSESTAIQWGRKYDVPIYIIAYPGEW